MEMKLDSVDHTLNETQKNVNKINHGIFGGLVNLFEPKKKKQEKKPEVNEGDRPKVDISSYEEQARPKIDFVSLTRSDREKEINENMDELSKGLNMLGGLAKDLSREIDRQNEKIKSITDKSDKANIKLSEQTKILKKN